MIDRRVDQITEDLGKLKEYVTKVHELLLPEAVSYELIRGDVQSQLAKKEKLIEENKILQGQIVNLKREIEESKNVAKAIIETAQEQKRKILAEGIQKLEEVKQFCNSIEKRKLSDHLEKIKA